MNDADTSVSFHSSLLVNRPRQNDAYTSASSHAFLSNWSWHNNYQHTFLPSTRGQTTIGMVWSSPVIYAALLHNNGPVVSANSSGIVKLTSDANVTGTTSFGFTGPFSVAGCSSWQPANHVLFQLANAALGIGLMAPDGTYGVLFLHSTFLLGFLLLSAWSWVILCAPDFFSWNFAFMVMNGIQILLITYQIRPVKFCDELEEVYVSVFQPLRVPRCIFKKLTNAEFCTLMTLYQGECYATQSITKTDKLGLLISGMLSVYSSRNFLHHIYMGQFIDTPEFESSVSGEEKYQVSIVADTTCRYIFWSRHSLEYLMIKEPYLAAVLSLIFGRDITNKLYALNEKVLTPHGSRMDIRLPSISSSIHSGRDITKTIGTMPHSVQMTIVGSSSHTHDNEDEDADVFQEHGEKVELLNGHVNHYQGQTQGCDSSTCVEHRSIRGQDVRFDM